MIPDYIKILKEYYSPANAQNAFTIQWHPVPEIEYRDGNNLAQHVYAYDRQLKHFYRRTFTDRLRKLTEDKKFDELEELLREFAKYIIMYMFIRDARRCFIRPSASSQEMETISQRMMAKITIEEGLDIDRRYDDDCDGTWDEMRGLHIEQCELDF